METGAKKAIVDLLFAEQCSCVVRNGDTVRIFRQRGIADLYNLLRTERQLLEGAFVADKVVGKGAAALMALGGVKEVFADTLSRPARKLLERYGIEVCYTLEVENIANRAGDGICPVEALCAACNTAEQCLPLISDFVERMTKNNKSK